MAKQKTVKKRKSSKSKIGTSKNEPINITFQNIHHDEVGMILMKIKSMQISLLKQADIDYDLSTKQTDPVYRQSLAERSKCGNEKEKMLKYLVSFIETL